MSPQECIAALDNALAEAGEDIVLRRVVGSGSRVQNIDVKCRARVNSVSVQEIAAGIMQTDQNVILSPTQINNAQWPGGTVPLVPPFDVDQRVPRTATDKAIVQKRLRTVAFVDPQFVNGELVRINMRVTG